MRNNPCRADSSTGVLGRLLKEDIFTALNAEYCSLLFDQLTSAERLQCLQGASHVIPRDSAPKSHKRKLGTNAENARKLEFERILQEDRPPHCPTMSTKAIRLAAAAMKHTRKGHEHLKSKNCLCCPYAKPKLGSPANPSKKSTTRYTILIKF